MPKHASPLRGSLLERLSTFVPSHPEAARERAAGTKLLVSCTRQARRPATLLGVAGLIRAGASLLMPMALARSIDAAVRDHGLASSLVLLAAVLAVIAVAESTVELAGAYYAADVTADIRRRLVHQSLRLGVAGQEDFPAGNLVSRLTVDAAAPAAFVPLITSASLVLLTTVGGVIALALIHWLLAVTFLVGVPIALFVVKSFVANASEPYQRYQQVQAEIVTRLVDAQRGARTIRVSGTLLRELGRVLAPLPRLHEAGRLGWAVQRQVSWKLQLLAPSIQVVVLAVGGWLLARGMISPGDMIGASAYIGMALGGLELVDVIVGALHCQVGAGRVATVLAAPLPVTPPAQPRAVPVGGGLLEMHDVAVRRAGRTVLKISNLVVPAGTSLAVVGRSGAGKSTLVALIGRLIAPDAGAVYLDGADIATLEPHALRRAITYGFERPALLGDTVHDMIAYGRPHASRAQVEAAGRAAQADPFIRRLPAGYDTPLREVPLSGGEAQRLGLARTILGDARLVVLDDATSSLDTATEVSVLEALDELLAHRTSVVVAHRATTAARADRVAWLENGRLRGYAAHRQLWTEPDYRASFAAETPEPAPAPELLVGR